MVSQPAADRRVSRSRSAILDAYRVLFFEHGFDGIDVTDIASKADVGRSTFYKHFKGKEDLLVQSLAPFLTRLAQACVSAEQPEHLLFVPEHFWENRRFARVVFSGQSLALITRALAGLIEAQLAAWLGPHRPAFPLTLAAGQLAAAQMTLLDQWLRGRGACPPGLLAAALHSSSYAAAVALTGGPASRSPKSQPGPLPE